MRMGLLDKSFNLFLHRYIARYERRSFLTSVFIALLNTLLDTYKLN